MVGREITKRRNKILSKNDLTFIHILKRIDEIGKRVDNVSTYLNDLEKRIRIDLEDLGKRVSTSFGVLEARVSVRHKELEGKIDDMTFEIGRKIQIMQNEMNDCFERGAGFSYGPESTNAPTYRTQTVPPAAFLKVRREDWRDEHFYRR